MNSECLDKWTNHDAEDEHKPGEKEQKDTLASRDSLLLLICVRYNVNWFEAAQKPKGLLLLLLICYDFRSHRFESRDYSSRLYHDENYFKPWNFTLMCSFLHLFLINVEKWICLWKYLLREWSHVEKHKF